jgi:hypothetical protein
MGFPDISSASNWIDVLKWLVPLATSIVTAAIAVIVAIIAYQQWRVNREKLRLDLYNRRFDIYLRCLNLHEQLIGHGSPDENLLDPFFRAFRESRFMFPDSGVQDLLGKLLIEGVRVRDLNKEMHVWPGWQDPDPDAEAYVRERNEITERVKPIIFELEKMMAPFP